MGRSAANLVMITIDDGVVRPPPDLVIPNTLSILLSDTEILLRIIAIVSIINSEGSRSDWAAYGEAFPYMTPLPACPNPEFIVSNTHLPSTHLAQLKFDPVAVVSMGDP